MLLFPNGLCIEESTYLYRSILF